MSEETRKAKVSVYRAVFWSIFTNAILAFVMCIVLLVAMGSVKDALTASNPIISILMKMTNSTRGTTAKVAGLVVIAFSVSLAAVASISQLIWA